MSQSLAQYRTSVGEDEKPMTLLQTLKMSPLTLLTLLLLTACTSPDNRTFLLASKNFTYVSDGDTDSWQRFDSVSSKFSGDCEDFAFTLQAQIGGTVWLVKLHNAAYPWHAVLVKDGKAYDSYYKRIIAVELYNAEFISIMIYSDGEHK